MIDRTSDQRRTGPLSSTYQVADSGISGRVCVCKIEGLMIAVVEGVIRRDLTYEASN